MKAYVITTGAVFGLLTLAHAWRVIAEDPHLATDPWFVLTKKGRPWPYFKSLDKNVLGS